MCGRKWLDVYLDTLSRKDKSGIKMKSSNDRFRFGSGKLYPSECHATIPIYIGQSRYELGVDVVSCTIPLLLSRDSLQRANAQIDIGNATITFMGATVPMVTTNSGHLCLDIGRSHDVSNPETKRVLSNVLFSSPLNGVGLDLRNKVKKLHKQFAHPSAQRLVDLVKNSGTTDSKIFDMINEVSSTCETCVKYKRPPLRPAVGFPLACEFNETVAIDLKPRGPNMYILHMIDHLTRYSSACIIYNKKKETIVRAMFDYWIRIFGCPKSFLSDNGGEFINQDVVDLAEKCNIVLKTTAAESGFSNGLCERHNGILNATVDKVMASNDCCIDIALHWSVAAKNSLTNVYGYSPNVLVFGRNPNYPSVFLNKPPANNTTCVSEIVAQNLNAMHSARNAFIQQESAERLRRALNRKVRNYSDNVFLNGDRVYYWRNRNTEWHGPAVVIGKDRQQVLVKHGGSYVRVHPCRLQFCQEADSIADKSNENQNSASYQPVEPAVESSAVANTVTHAPSVPESSSPDNDSDYSDSNIENSSSNTLDEEGWTSVKNHKDLPKVSSTVQCKFPDVDGQVTCKILSKAGKSSTANWHYLNVQEANGEGKCCSFKDVSWKTTENESLEPSTSDTFFGSQSDDHASFIMPKLQEIEKWKHFKTFQEVPNTGQDAISTRWVCTRKIKGGQVTYKARLVARGFEENSKTLKTDSPTCSKESLRLLLAIISCRGWKLHSLDVKSAFLQGALLERDVFIKPPKEANTSCLWKMYRCPYGLADSGRLWYLRLKNELILICFVQCKYDHAVFMWFDIEGNLAGVLAVHVDDIIYGGSRQFHREVVSKLRSTFSIGLEEETNLKYLGLDISQRSECIQISTKGYGLSLNELPLPHDVLENMQFSSEQVTLLKQFCGQINWLSTQGRPDISFDCCYIANSLKSGDRKVFAAANKIVKKVKNQDVTLAFYSDFDVSSCSVVSFCDASFANLPNAGSQGGYISLLVDKNGVNCPLTWQSRKVKRVVKSTLAAECLAAVACAEMTIYLARLIEDILKIPGNSVETYVFCDNKNLVNAVHSSTNLEDKRLIIDVSVLRDFLLQKELTKFEWVATESQLANTFTKQGASDKLLLNVLNQKLMFNFGSASFE